MNSAGAFQTEHPCLRDSQNQEARLVLHSQTFDCRHKILAHITNILTSNLSLFERSDASNLATYGKCSLYQNCTK